MLVAHIGSSPLLAAATSWAQRNTQVPWNSATLQGIRDAKLGVPVVACMYDAWAAYDERAVGTQLGGAY